MRHLMYVGSINNLQGKCALVRDMPDSKTRGVLAQFDGCYFHGGQCLAYGWHCFYDWEFREIKDEEYDDTLRDSQKSWAEAPKEFRISEGETAQPPY